MTTLSTPSGKPGIASAAARAPASSAGSARGLDHHRAAGGDRRADLAGAHGRRESSTASPAGTGRPAASWSAAVPCRPARSSSARRSAPPPRRTSGRTRRRRRSRPADSARLLPISSVISRASSSWLVDHRLIGAAQDLAALARRGGGPAGRSLVGGRQRGEARRAGEASATSQSGWPVAGSSTEKVLPCDASRHCAPDEQLLGDGVEAACLFGWACLSTYPTRTVI